MHTATSKVDWIKADIMIKNVSTAKTIIHVCLDTVHDVENSSDEFVTNVLFETEGLFVWKIFSSKLILDDSQIFLIFLIIIIWLIKLINILKISYQWVIQ